MMMTMTPIIEIQQLGNYLGNNWVHRDLTLTIYEREILGIIGGSGSGKTTLLRCILMLLRPTTGQIRVFGQDILHLNPSAAFALRQRWGVLFQENALFSSLTVLENIMFPLRTYTHLSASVCAKIALLKLGLVGLPADAAYKFPAELSGGMRKRAALARAIAMDPEILFLDEPTSGLDPQSAYELDSLILKLRDGLGLTVVAITHDVDLLWRITDRVAFLGDKKVLAVEPIKQLANNPQPAIQEYFSSVKDIMEA